MFDIGFSELVLIALIALIVLGPKRLPEAARAAGRWTAKLRHFITNVKHDFDSEMRNAEIMELQKLKQELDDTRRAMQDVSGHMIQRIGEFPTDASKPATTPFIEPLATPPIKKKRAKTGRSKKSKKASTTQPLHGSNRTKRTKPV